ncbi:hypothetical protein IJG11_03260 [Candidatus Saccharibacteria bacterium]|nr:hypothetical protein [Candidatus Saccharibacteria bacterium]
MPNPEAPEFNSSATGSGEFTSETPRYINEERGEKANNAVINEKKAENAATGERQYTKAEQARIDELVSRYQELIGISQRMKENIAAKEQASAGGEQLPEDPTTPEDSPASSEQQPTPENLQSTIEKAKKNRGLKGVLIATVSLVMAGIIAAGTWAMFHLNGDKNKTNLPDQPISTEAFDATLGGGENQEAKGIYDGYGEKGMWLSENKGGTYDFASAKETAEACDDDECEMMKYTSRNQVESYADYIANLPEELQPEGFKGLTILEAEKKLESLPDEEYDAIKQQFDGIVDGAFTRDVTLDGDYYNSYMRLIDPSKPATHDNMELVECTTHESGTRAVELYWTDDGTAYGKVIGTMTVKITRDDNGNIIGGCMQVVNPVGTHSNIYTGMGTVTDNPTPGSPTTPSNPTPDNPTPDKPDTPTETIKPKDPDNLIRIDEQIQEDIAEDIGTDEVRVTPNPGVSDNDITDRPSSDDYQGTSPDIVQNDDSREAEPVQDQVSPENNYSEDRGGANADEYSPVQDDQAAQDAADAAEIPVNEAPTGGTELNDILGELGIN